MIQGTRRMRRVRVTKIMGEDNKGIRPHESVLGFEKTPPKTGECYRIVLEKGGLFRSSPVKWTAHGFIHTLNSLYMVENS